jgi:L-seryl-tRNA(Ser) seleniumtransferase
MLRVGEDTLAARCARLRAGIGQSAVAVRVAAKVGGGALPLLELDGPAVALESIADPVEVTHALRQATVPVIARIHDRRVVLNPRTLSDDEVDDVVAAVRAALAS